MSRQKSVSARKTNESDVRTYPDRPIPAVGIVVWRGDEILLIQRGKPPRKGEWTIPGGAQRLGETIFEAAIREVREEAGIVIEPYAVITAIDMIHKDQEGRVLYHYLVPEVAADWREGDLIAGDDVADARWASVDEARKLPDQEALSHVLHLALMQRLL